MSLSQQVERINKELEAVDIKLVKILG